MYVCVEGWSDGSSVSDRSSWWNDSTTIDDDDDATGLGRSPTASDPGRGGQLGSQHCRSNADCNAAAGTAAGVSCYWLYDGCQTGRCMCDPRRHLQALDGRCIPRKLLSPSWLVGINHGNRGRTGNLEWGTGGNAVADFANVHCMSVILRHNRTRRPRSPVQLENFSFSRSSIFCNFRRICTENTKRLLLSRYVAKFMRLFGLPIIALAHKSTIS